MKRLASLNMAQRIVIVVTLAVLFYILGFWLSVLDKRLITGWVAYAPLTNATTGEPGGLSVGEDVLVWAGLALVWAFLSVMALKSPRDGENSRTGT